MKKLFVMVAVSVLMFAASVQGVSASEVCLTQSVSCAEAIGLQNARWAAGRERASEASAARYNGLATYFAQRATSGPRAESTRNQALADYYETLPWDTATMSKTRGVGGLYSR